MAGPTPLERWRGGETVRLVAPFLDPQALRPPVNGAGAQARLLMLLPSDAEALVWACATRSSLLLRTTARVARTRALTGPLAVVPATLVTSVDSLHCGVLRREIGASLAGVPWCVWGAERLQPWHPAALGRLSWVARQHADCAGGGLLWLFSDGEAAGDGALLWDGAAGHWPGPLRVLPSMESMAALVAQAGPAISGLALTRSGDAEALRHLLGEAGVSCRARDLSVLRPAAWRAAESALREPELGIEVLDPGAFEIHPSVEGLTLLADPPASIAELCLPAAAFVLRRPAEPTAAAPVLPASALAAAIEGCRSRLRAGGTDWFAVPGDDAAAPASLLADLAAADALAELRPCTLSARVADSHRFRAPFVDREPEYSALHADYSRASARWGLAERARFALTDRAPQDLRVLAAQLGRRPAEMADILLAMTDDGLLVAELSPLGGGTDWQAIPGPAWDEDDASLAARILDLRERRRRARASAAEALGEIAGAAPRCRRLALWAALGVGQSGERALGPCGVCDLCDPSGSAWAEALRGAARGEAGPGDADARAVAHAPTVGSALSLGALFSSLSASSASPSAGVAAAAARLSSPRPAVPAMPPPPPRPAPGAPSARATPVWAAPRGAAALASPPGAPNAPARARAPAATPRPPEPSPAERAAHAARAAESARSHLAQQAWDQAEAALDEAVSWRLPPADAVTLHFDAVQAALVAGEERWSRQWLETVLTHPQGALVARQVAMLVWSGKIPSSQLPAMRDAVKSARNPAFDGALRALEDALRRARR